jgi:hypothetical protein
MICRPGTRRHRGGGRGRERQLIAATDDPLTPIAVAPGGGSQFAERAREGESIACTVYFPLGTDVVNSDELTVRGERFSVIVNDWRSPCGPRRPGSAVHQGSGLMATDRVSTEPQGGAEVLKELAAPHINAMAEKDRRAGGRRRRGQAVHHRPRRGLSVGAGPSASQGRCADPRAAAAGLEVRAK